MTLHDKARAVVKKGDLKTALEIFLQADSEGFSKWYIYFRIVQEVIFFLPTHVAPKRLLS